MVSSILAAALLVASAVTNPGVVEVPPPVQSEAQAPVPFPVPLPVEVQAPAHVTAPAPGVFPSPGPVDSPRGLISYREFMGVCSYFAQEEGMQGMALGAMALLCHCSYKQIEGRMPMNKENLMAASKVCEGELRHDPRAFILKYLDEAERALKATSP